MSSKASPLSLRLASFPELRLLQRMGQAVLESAEIAASLTNSPRRPLEIEALAAHQADARLWVATDPGGCPQAYLAIAAHRPTLTLTSYAIHPNHADSTTAKVLVKHLEKLARQQGAPLTLPVQLQRFAVTNPGPLASPARQARFFLPLRQHVVPPSKRKTSANRSCHGPVFVFGTAP